MTNESRNDNDETAGRPLLGMRALSSFGFAVGFVIRISPFVIAQATFRRKTILPA
jgi:hypothetical protein